MKKRIILVTLAVVLLLIMVMPTAALAKNNKWGQMGQWGKPTNFSGAGLIYVTYMPDPIIKGNVWRYQGEIVEGFLDQCDWDLLAGTVFWSDHDSTVSVDDQYNARGFMRGTFSLTRPDGSGVLSGTFSGKIQGNLYTGDISDTGSWRATRGTGVFEGVQAWGEWSAELQFGEIGGQVTLLGPLNWSGKYKSGRDAREDAREIVKEIKDRAREQTEKHVRENNRDKVHDCLDKWNKNR